MEVDFAPVARVCPKPTDGPRLAKVSTYRSSCTKLGITKKQVENAYGRQKREAIRIDEQEWSDAEDGDNEAEPGNGF